MRPDEARERRRNRQRWLTTGGLVLLFLGLAIYAWVERRSAESPAGGGTGSLAAFWEMDVSELQSIRVEYPRDPSRAELVLVRNGGAPAKEGQAVVTYSPVPRFSRVTQVPFVTYRPPRRDASWQITGPLKAPANDNVMTSLVRNLAKPVPEAEVRTATELASETTGREQQLLGDYGLERPQAIVHLEFEGGRQEELRVGDATPITAWGDIPEGYYVYTPARRGVYTLAASVLDPLLKGADSLRDLRVGPFDPAKANRVRITWIGSSSSNGSSSSPGAGGQTGRVQPVLLERLSEQPEVRWQVLSPAKVPADSARIQGLLADLASLQAASVEGADLARYGLDNPHGEVVVWLSDGDDLPVARVFYLGTGTPDGNYIYVRADDDPTVYRVDAWRLETTRQNARDWLGLVSRTILPGRWGWSKDLAKSLAEIRWWTKPGQVEAAGTPGGGGDKAGGPTGGQVENALLPGPDGSWRVLQNGQEAGVLRADAAELQRLWNALSSLRFERVTGLGRDSRAGTVELLILRPQSGKEGENASSDASASLPVEIRRLDTGSQESGTRMITLEVDGEGFTRRGEMAEATWQELEGAWQEVLDKARGAGSR